MKFHRWAGAWILVACSPAGPSGPTDDAQVDVAIDLNTDASVDVAADVSEAGTTLPCLAPDQMCGNDCTDIRTDFENCGACGQACVEGQVCSGGSCFTECPDGTERCGGGCFSLVVDPRACGACGLFCRPGELCDNGACSCPLGQGFCGDRCIDLEFDPGNCGGCGTMCGDGQFCVYGTCQDNCDPLTTCGDRCVRIGQDRQNCGACGATCEQGRVCDRGTCVCPFGETLCGNTCVNLDTDPNHCGDCLSACTNGSLCDFGTCSEGCSEEGSTTLCGSQCNDIRSDREHCGACGVRCSVACIDGACVEPVDLRLGDDFACVLMSEGTVWCWGRNTQGQLGDNSGEDSERPVQVARLAGARALFVGSRGACALLETGAVSCWGNNHLGQISDINSPFLIAPQPLTATSGVTRMALGGTHSCAIVTGGAVRCWGGNFSGQLGNGTTEDSRLGVVVALPGPATEVALGNSHSCALLDNRRVFCWGDNESDQLSIDSETLRNAVVPVELSQLPDVVQLSAFDGRTCVVTAGGVPQCWGALRRVPSGMGGATAVESSPESTNVLGFSGRQVLGISTGRFHTLTVTDLGNILTFGQNQYGELGNGSGLASESAAITVTGLNGVTRVAAGDSQSCALRQGQVFCWGSGVGGDSRVPRPLAF